MIPNLVYADPPWRYLDATLNRAVENHYPTLTVPEIIALSPERQRDSVVLLWATSPKLAEALAVMEGWGFAYKTCAVWDKVRLGMGYYWRQQHELLLLGTVGHPGVPSPSSRPRSIFAAPRRRHSQKPDEVYDMIEAMFPHLTDRLEMFARNTRPGWVSWGNEVPE